MSRRKIEVRQDLAASLPSPPPSRPQNVPTIRKDQFCFKRTRDPCGQAKDHDWYARDRTTTIRAGKPFGHHVPRPSRLKARLAADLIAPSGLDRMRFLFTMSKSRTLPLSKRDARPSRQPVPMGQDRLDALRRKLPLKGASGAKRNGYASDLSSKSLRPPRRGKRRLVEPDGIEPTTSCLQSTRSPN